MNETSASILGSILGTLITAIATIAVAKIQKLPEEGSSTAPSIALPLNYKPRPKKQNLWLLIALFAAGAFAGGVFGYLLSIWINSSAPTTTNNPATPTLTLAPTLTPIPCSFNSKPSTRHVFPPSNLTGTITSPKHCERGLLSSRYSPITVDGNIGQIPDNLHSWLFVYGPDGKYYPQCNNIPATKTDCTVSGEWSMRVYLGSECKPYSLVLISTNNDGTNFLLTTMNIWEKSGSYTGLRSDELKPYGIKELYSIQIETGLCAIQTSTP